MYPAALIAALAFVLVCTQPVFADAKADYDRAMVLEKKGKLEDAAASIHLALKQEPRNDLYLATAGHLEYSRGKYAEAYSYATQALLVRPTGWYKVVAARAAFALGQYPESKHYAQQAYAMGKATLGPSNYTDVEEILHQFDPYRIVLVWRIPPERFARKDVGYAATVTVPLAEIAYQKAQLRVNGAHVARDYMMYGNRLLELTAASPEKVEIVAEISRTPIDYALAMAQQDKGGELPPDYVKPYLGSSHKVNIDSPALHDIASSLKGATAQETVQKILSWMNAHLRYQHSEFTTPEEVLTRGYGESLGWSSVFTALARLNGILARNVWGMANTPGFATAGFLKAHTWAEFYLSGIGWVPIEPQYPGTLGTLPSHYLRVAHSTMSEGADAVSNLPDMAKVVKRER